MKLYFLVFFLTRFIHLWCLQKNLSKLDFWWKKVVYEWMHVCMIMLQKQWKHGEVKSIMLESRVNMPFGKDYGFNCTCNKVLPSSQSLQPLPNIIGLQDYSWSNKIRRKVSFECSIAYQLIKDYSWLATALRPKMPRWVKGN